MLGNDMIEICKRTTINISLCLYYCGSEACKPNQLWGPKVIDHFLVYYITDGQGTLEVNNTKYELHKGQGFLISPNALSCFKSDEDNPWKYAWVGFSGYRAEEYLRRANLFVENPVFTYDEDDFLEYCFEKMIEFSKIKHNRYCKIMSILYIIISHLIDIANDSQVKIKVSDQNEYYVRKALEFIDMNYYKKISITEISNHVGIHRKYFHYIFKNSLDVSPQEYLINYRINRACELMTNNMLTISHIACSVGYTDQFHFSKMFKKVIGVSPKEYRENLAELENVTELHKAIKKINQLKKIIAQKDNEIIKLKKFTNKK